MTSRCACGAEFPDNKELRYHIADVIFGWPIVRCTKEHHDPLSEMDLKVLRWQGVSSMMIKPEFQHRSKGGLSMAIIKFVQDLKVADLGLSEDFTLKVVGWGEDWVSIQVQDPEEKTARELTVKVTAHKQRHYGVPNK